MKEEKFIHKGYEDYVKSRSMGRKTIQLFGKWQYVFSNKVGIISLIQQKRSYNNAPNFWEIYCLNGDLFEDVKRFYGRNGKRNAIKVIKEYLKVDDLSELIEKKIKRIDFAVKKETKTYKNGRDRHK